MHASYKVFVCYKLRFMLIHGNPRAEQTEPSIRSARFGIGRDETEHRPTLLGRTEIETEHPLAPRDRTEISNLYPETSPSSTQSRFARFVCRPDRVMQCDVHRAMYRVAHRIVHCAVHRVVQ